MTEAEIKHLVKIAEYSQGIEPTNAMRLLHTVNPTYHWCMEYDGMVICDTDPEWKNCTCFDPRKEIMART